MKRTIIFIIGLVLLSCFDALRDTMRGRWDYWPYHTVKWLAFYPPLIYVWAKEVVGWKAKNLCVVLAWLGWSICAWVTRPPHWGPMTWGWSVFGF